MVDIKIGGLLTHGRLNKYFPTQQREGSFQGTCFQNSDIKNQTGIIGTKWHLCSAQHSFLVWKYIAKVNLWKVFSLSTWKKSDQVAERDWGKAGVGLGQARVDLQSQHYSGCCWFTLFVNLHPEWENTALRRQLRILDTPHKTGIGWIWIKATRRFKLPPTTLDWRKCVSL